MATEKLNFLCTTNIFFGSGRVHELPQYIEEQSYKRLLLVVDPFWWRSRSEVKVVVQELTRRKISIAIVSEVEPDPSLSCVEDAKQRLKSDGCELFDVILAIGGGSTIDLAKGLSVLLPYDGSLSDLIVEIPSTLIPTPLIACPTTSGTGSELTPGAIFRQSGDDAKVGIMSNSLRPTAAFIDPDLTLSCPRGLTIDSALDALTHAVESYIALPTEGYSNVAVAAVYSGANLVTKTFAQKAISLVFEHLPVVAREPNSRDSRSGMALASLFAAMSYSTAGLHGVHAMSYAIASLSHKPHGQTLAIVLPESLWELRHVCEEELAELGRMLGGCHESKAADAEYFIDRLRTLLRELDVSTNLSDWGIREGQIDRLVEDSVAIHRLSKAFPIQPPKEAYRRIFKSAL